LPTKAARDELLETVALLYRDHRPLLEAALPVLLADAGAGCTPEHMDPILCTLLAWFGRRHRWEAAAEFFLMLQPACSWAAVYAAAALKKLGQVDAAGDALADAVHSDPSHAQARARTRALFGFSPAIAATAAAPLARRRRPLPCD